MKLPEAKQFALTSASLALAAILRPGYSDRGWVEPLLAESIVTLTISRRQAAYSLTHSLIPEDSGHRHKASQWRMK